MRRAPSGAGGEGGGADIGIGWARRQGPETVPEYVWSALKSCHALPARADDENLKELFCKQVSDLHGDDAPQLPHEMCLSKREVFVRQVACNERFGFRIPLQHLLESCCDAVEETVAVSARVQGAESLKARVLAQK